MKLTSTNIDPVSMRLSVEVEEGDYRTKVAEELKKIGRTHQIPGFRKGHISVKELERRFGKQVTSDVINNVVYEAVIKYIQENKLNVLGQPLPVEVKELDLKNQTNFTFEYDIALAPELDVEVDKNIHVPFYNIEVSEQMIDEQDAAFRKRFGAQVPGEEFEKDALVKGAIMQLNEDGTVKEGDDAIQVVSGILAPMYFTDKDEAAKFEGKKVGDKVVFNPRKATGGNITELSSMLNIDKNRVAEVQGDFEMSISEIIVVKPAELGEEFYTNVFGKDKVTNEEEYRNGVKEMIANELLGNSDMIFRWSARKVYMEKYGNMELPAALLKKWLINTNENINETNVDAEYERMENDLKWQLIYDRMMEKLGVTIEKEDLLEFAKGLAARQFAQYGMTNMDDETITRYAENILTDKNYIGRIREQVGEVKGYNALKQAISLDEETVSLDKFKEIAANI
ncbi:MAG: trigger factor [Firmicutes bacterium]|nr:trigger factor [Bacillota bacterium]MCM1401924.1 trigger factor [Bacteroides sp.]MCM1476654.1 trigger factor [Bacteroides sp.]